MVFGKKKAKPASDSLSFGGEDVVIPSLEIKTIGIAKDEAQGLMIAARQLPGYPVALVVLANAITSRADRILMDYSAQGATVRYRIDGVWETLPPVDRPTGDAALVVYKKMFGLNPAERRAKQDAKFATNFKDTDWVITFTSAGVPSGERVLFQIDTKKPTIKTLNDLGMREAMQETFRGMLNADKGIVLVSAPPGQGLPTSWRISLESADKFVRDFVSLVNKAEPDPEIINVSQNYFEVGVGESPEEQFEKMLLKQPDVLVMPSLVNSYIADRVIDQINTHGKHSITRIVATDAVDAIIKLLTTYKPEAKEMVKLLSGVLNQRLVRRLCENCKQPFQPTPQLLQKLGIPAGRVQKLFQPTIPPPPEQRVDAKGNPIEIEICKKCNGRGYFGRMAIFELLTVDNKLRQVILKSAGTPDAIRQFAKQNGHLGFQEEGILACALGMTSLQEIQKMMAAKS
ncbi:MAG TPA: ATPase, T2SS/T4P/T4SS family [Pirellula sp.]|nr:ATPase, T2SS/T4P/T4SS family [Pirellula sp.]